PFEIRYEWICYRDSWGTSQLGGRLEFVWQTGSGSLGLAFHNDLFGLLVRDEYRTAALELASGFRALGADCSASVGMRLWTGSTWGQGRLHWGQSYAMTLHPPGAGYSAGILYAGFRWGMVRLELGWDSEGIRDFIQNGTHRIIDDGKVPLVDRAARPYIALSLFPDGGLY
ncbi:MAG TPA: polymorphic toxin type 23 domain-containing protein, partial [Rectinemataceae bacterium]|nr:polymorphic toxin type 23 domain-containing protein [Rectinemataceae bacterium]